MNHAMVSGRAFDIYVIVGSEKKYDLIEFVIRESDHSHPSSSFLSFMFIFSVHQAFELPSRK